MKTKILLLVFTAVLSMSFTTKPKAPNLDITTKIVCLNNEEIAILKLDVDVNSYQIGIEWIDDAVYQGSMNWSQIRDDIRAHYENESGKSPNEIIIDNNKEVWFFDGTVPKSTVQEEIEKDGDIDTDTDGD